MLPEIEGLDKNNEPDKNVELQQAIETFAELGNYCKQEGFEDLARSLVASADNISIYNWGQVLKWHRHGDLVSRETVLSIRRTLGRENKTAYVVWTSQSIEEESPKKPVTTSINDQSDIGILSKVSIQEISEEEFALRFTGESGRPFTIKVYKGEPSVERNKFWDGYVSVDSPTRN